jgi:hypothetical protein
MYAHRNKPMYMQANRSQSPPLRTLALAYAGTTDDATNPP